MAEPMTVLWDSKVADDVTGGQSSAPWTCRGISIDTRTLEKGDLFVALKGETGDGHEYLRDAASRGAVAGLVSGEGGPELPLLRVKDPLQALESLGIAARQRSSALRLAVTGSVGKTSTKEMLRWVFKDQGQTHGSVASYNNHWGVPLTLARMPQMTQFAVFEVGMNHTGEIRPLSHMIKPHIALITAIVEAHIEFFKSVEDIALAKAEIFEGMEAGSSALLNQDSPHFDLLAKKAKEHGLDVFSFGTDTRSTFRLLSYEREAEKGCVRAEIGGMDVSYTLPMVGAHWTLNSLSVLGAVHLAGADVKAAAHSLATFEVPTGRGRRYKGAFTVLDESYNANPASMRAALEIVGHSTGKRKLAVIGDMRELGKVSQQHHEELLEPLLENKIDLVYCCGPHMAYLFERLPKAMRGGYALSSAELLPLVMEAVEPGDVITVKASLGTHVKPIVEALLERQKHLGS